MAWWGRQLYVRVTELGFPLEVLQPFLGSRVRSALWQQQAAAAASSNQQRACTQKVFLGHYGSKLASKFPIPPLQSPTPCNPPPPGGGLSLSCFSSWHVLRWFVLPICFTHGLVLRSHYFKSITCVYFVMFSLQRRSMGVLCCYFRPKMFSPSDRVRYHSHTLGAHVLATVVGPSPNGPQFCHIQYMRPGGVTPLDHESAQLSMLEAVAVEWLLFWRNFWTRTQYPPVSGG